MSAQKLAGQSFPLAPVSKAHGVPSAVKYRTQTLGCKVNQYETQAMRELLGESWSEAAPGEKAGLVLVNTCAVTAEAERQSRQALRKARRDNPNARIVAAGCAAARPGVDLVSEGLADVVLRHPSPGDLPLALGLPGGARPGISRFDGHSRAFVKVQDGCDRRCSFCIVPSVRGDSVSRPAVEVLEEVSRLVAGGVPEVVLCGVRLNAWRDKGSGKGLESLLEAVLAVKGLRRVRLSSVHPGGVGPGLLELLVSHPRMSRHVHLPVQSGSDRVLKAMRRGYTASEVRSLAGELRVRCPEMGLTADCIAGFPGETEEDFRATEELVRDCGFDRLHVFPFSPRPGTPAAKMQGMSPAIIRRRAERLRAVSAELAGLAAAGKVGRELEVVVEGRVRGGAFRALTDGYLPVRFPASGAAPGAVARVMVTGRVHGTLTGVLVEGGSRA
jgi:threonylcarbamoyladenosine tRNA methylthiotransferase MtaB